MQGQIKKIVVVKLSDKELIAKSAEQNYNADQREKPTNDGPWEGLCPYLKLDYISGAFQHVLLTGKNRVPTYPDNEWYHVEPETTTLGKVLSKDLILDEDVAEAYAKTHTTLNGTPLQDNAIGLFKPN